VIERKRKREERKEREVGESKERGNRQRDRR
jgi:hypothetical protein